jgi:hypothetical protein
MKREREHMDQQTYVLHFEGISHGEANRYAEELRNALLNASPEIVVQRQRSDPRTQDFGSTLILLLGTPAIVTAATAIGNWLLLRSKASITIETIDNKIVANNISGKDAAHIAELLLTQQKNHP